MTLGDYRAFELCPSSGILKNTFRKLYLFPPSDEGVGDTYSVGPVRAPIHVEFCLQFELTGRTETVLPVAAPHHTQTDRTVSSACQAPRPAGRTNGVVTVQRSAGRPRHTRQFCLSVFDCSGRSEGETVRVWGP
jgi:hypothetical protein